MPASLLARPVTPTRVSARGPVRVRILNARACLLTAEAGGNWSLFCPSEAPGLVDLHGDEFTQAYEAYERDGRAQRVVPAQQLWFAILESQVCVIGPCSTARA